MYKVRRSSKEWFKAWDEIISLEGKLSRVKLSEISGATRSSPNGWAPTSIPSHIYEAPEFSCSGQGW